MSVVKTHSPSLNRRTFCFLTENQTAKAILKVNNATDSYLVIGNNAIYIITNMTANGGQYAKAVLLAAINGSEFAFGKINNLGQLVIGTVSNGAANALYVLKNGKLVVLIPNVSQAGGMAWNKNQTLFYFVDSGKGCVYEYQYNSSTGDICKAPEV